VQQQDHGSGLEGGEEAGRSGGADDKGEDAEKAGLYQQIVIKM
jgi:hypothetical protein